MVQVKLSIAFVLAAAAIAPIVALPAVPKKSSGHHESIDGANKVHSESSSAVTRMNRVNHDTKLRWHLHRNTNDVPVDSAKEATRTKNDNEGLSTRDYIEMFERSLDFDHSHNQVNAGRHVRHHRHPKHPKPSTGTSETDDGIQEDKEAVQRAKDKDAAARGLSRRDYIEMFERSLDDLDFEARDYYDDLDWFVSSKKIPL